MDKNILIGRFDQVRTISVAKVFGTLLTLWLAYCIAIVVYRVWFSPIAKIPGPKLAALTFWYEFYYDVYPHKYQYGFKLRELHNKYGPIIRINPIHVHIHDHAYLDTIYASGNAHKRDRCSWSHHSGAKTLSGAMLEAMDHDLHKMRRNATSSFFSKRNVQVLEPLVVNTTNRLLARLKQDMHRDIGEGGKGIVNLNYAFAAMTMDIISEYCFGEGMNSMERSQYGKQMLDILHQGIQMRPLARQFPTFFNWMFDLPPEYVGYLSPDILPLNEFNAGLLRRITKIMDFKDDGGKGTGHQSIFHVFRDDPNVKLPPEEKTPFRLMAESSVFIGAGTETTSRTLAVTIYYLLKEKEVGMKLLEELKRILPVRGTTVSLPQLEALPYLSAVITEGLRVAHGVSSRQPRIPTNEDLTYGPYKIPRGTPVMESAYLIHTDPKIYPEPMSFRPQRWLDNSDLKKNWFAFGRGSRSCLGMNLATSELYFGIAFVWRWMELEIWGTSEERDVQTNYDCFIGMTSLGTESGVRVRILGKRME
ncbi:hypothetical protein DPSP01_012699 [Paraphaeosphaeria sporulosa]|uniref:Putative benzoate 4-monooxygenase cytochrome P450 n=1 Tax=Paraphaeosphaeria sporulosa TaxID=1460663 RepID=A0A177C8K6_9PLEO|nr:putative benzoate 4-monooxygenase cytochrome P450 [Paraphaeosphaeria sporulosa]OAG03192.1 putative benzoate 4-monooxygenase cytochrome P450 [Paraphaeosphaeria sporulosa]